ncbi:GNAT family N-acetyltransferase [Mesorhizobium sp. LHD-90]|uniref:GNAT family N-acetyltransferase n=1 Tax=Mesorhizobium sp. LHD-90 TaxID=3071414 RepID=UPI0027E07E40|nr:GNAT family N-acetyltransferase [Mesorhizobium sp. LHD-90]MDQ6433131.1 GNAT family N-acetyltransferase [Mesorhizobium sp. LHD-90]
MREGFHVRTAGEGDLLALLGLYRQLIPDDPELSLDAARDIFRRLGTYPGSAIFLGSVGDVLAATCTLVVIPNLTRGGASYGLIENVVTDAAHRGRGFGRAMLAEAAGAAWRSGCYKVMLLTGAKDPATLNFYERAGFRQDKTGFQMRRIPPRKA